VPYARPRLLPGALQALLDTRTDPTEAVAASPSSARTTVPAWSPPGAPPPTDDLLGHLRHRYVQTASCPGSRPLDGPVAAGRRARDDRKHDQPRTLTLLQHPNRRPSVRDGEPAVVNAAVEELLRRSASPTPAAPGGHRDVELARHDPGGEASSRPRRRHRDPAEFAHPTSSNLTGRSNHHVAFGVRRAPVPRPATGAAGVQVAYPALLRRFPALRVAGRWNSSSSGDEIGRLRPCTAAGDLVRIARHEICGGPGVLRRGRQCVLSAPAVFDQDEDGLVTLRTRHRRRPGPGGAQRGPASARRGDRGRLT